jgi:hypothetical protein
MHIRDFPGAGKSSLDTLSCTLAKGKWFPGSAFLCPHSRRGTSNSLLVGIRHTQKLEGDLQRGQISLALIRRLRKFAPAGRAWANSRCRRCRAGSTKAENKKHLLSAYSPVNWPWMSPQILSGASSSSKTGCERKISRDLRQRPRTSASVICTGFPGRHPRTSSNLVIKLSTSNSTSAIFSQLLKKTRSARSATNMTAAHSCVSKAESPCHLP